MSAEPAHTFKCYCGCGTLLPRDHGSRYCAEAWRKGIPQRKRGAVQWMGPYASTRSKP